MSSIVTYKRLQIVSPTPTGDGGLALNNDFQTLDNLVVFNQGAWNSSQTYIPNDLVRSGGTYYLCLSGNTNSAPPSGNWSALSTGSIPTLEQVTTAGGSTDQATTFSGGISVDGTNGGPGSVIRNVGILSFYDPIDPQSNTTTIAYGEEGLVVTPGLGSEAFEIAAGFVNGINLHGNSVNANNGSGGGGGKLAMEGGTLNMGGGTLNANNGSGSGGGTLNFDQAILYGGSGATIQDDGGGSWNVSGGINNIGGVVTIGPETLYWEYGNVASFANNGLFDQTAIEIIAMDFTISAFAGISGGQCQISAQETVLVQQFGTGQTNIPVLAGAFVSQVGLSAESTIAWDGISAVQLNAPQNCCGNSFNMSDGAGSGGGTLSMDGGVLANAQLMQLASQGSAPTAVAGGIYFDGAHFYGCRDGSTWTVII